jgi:hypothetical protein
MEVTVRFKFRSLTPSNSRWFPVNRRWGRSEGQSGRDFFPFKGSCVVESEMDCRKLRSPTAHTSQQSGTGSNNARHLKTAFRSHYGPWVDSASNRNEYQGYLLGGKGGRCIRLTTLPPSCADCLEIWEPQPPGNLRTCLCL